MNAGIKGLTGFLLHQRGKFIRVRLTMSLIAAPSGWQVDEELFLTNGMHAVYALEIIEAKQSLLHFLAE
jgi:hypothetical protein